MPQFAGFRKPIERLLELDQQGSVRLQNFLGELSALIKYFARWGLILIRCFFPFGRGVLRYVEGTSQTSMFIRMCCAKISTM